MAGCWPTRRPEQREKVQKCLWPARLSVSLQATFWLGVIAFGKPADTLAKYRKDDLVSVAGNMQLNQWMGQDGGTLQGYQVITDSVFSARTVRQSYKSGLQGQDTYARLRAYEQQPLATVHEGYGQKPPYDDSF